MEELQGGKGERMMTLIIVQNMTKGHPLMLEDELELTLVKFGTYN